MIDRKTGTLRISIFSVMVLSAMCTEGELSKRFFASDTAGCSKNCGKRLIVFIFIIKNQITYPLHHRT